MLKCVTRGVRMLCPWDRQIERVRQEGGDKKSYTYAVTLFPAIDDSPSMRFYGNNIGNTWRLFQATTLKTHLIESVSELLTRCFSCLFQVSHLSFLSSFRSVLLPELSSCFLYLGSPKYIHLYMVAAPSGKLSYHEVFRVPFFPPSITELSHATPFY